MDFIVHHKEVKILERCPQYFIPLFPQSCYNIFFECLHVRKTYKFNSIGFDCNSKQKFSLRIKKLKNWYQFQSNDMRNNKYTWWKSNNGHKSKSILFHLIFCGWEWTERIVKPFKNAVGWKEPQIWCHDNRKIESKV